MTNNLNGTIEDIINGKMVILVDDEGRENEGDLIIAAEKVEAADINFMAKYARGIICLALSGEMTDKLNIPLMSNTVKTSIDPAFTLSIDAIDGITTGVSAFDRAKTIEVAIADDVKPESVKVPGHIFPLRGKNWGVLERDGHTEGSIDLVKFAKLKPAAVICEIMNEDGTMARMPDLKAFAEKHYLRIVTIQEIIKYRLQTESIVQRVATAELPTKFKGFGDGIFKLTMYKNIVDGKEHVVLIKGDLSNDKSTLVRLHSECLTGDLLGSERCDCGFQYQRSLEMISEEENGVLLYLRQEGRGIGLSNKIKAYHIQDTLGLDTVDANRELGFLPDMRDYGVASQILRDLGIRKVNLLTNNPSKISGLELYGIEVSKRLPITANPTAFNRKYLEAKREKLGHILESI